jgi:hypothetical protein
MVDVPTLADDSESASSHVTTDSEATPSQEAFDYEFGPPGYENFHSEVAIRDCNCVVTGMRNYLCDSAYLIPYEKGDQV